MTTINTRKQMELEVTDENRTDIKNNNRLMSEGKIRMDKELEGVLTSQNSRD